MQIPGGAPLSILIPLSGLRCCLLFPQPVSCDQRRATGSLNATSCRLGKASERTATGILVFRLGLHTDSFHLLWFCRYEWFCVVDLLDARYPTATPCVTSGEVCICVRRKEAARTGGLSRSLEGAQGSVLLYCVHTTVLYQSGLLDRLFLTIERRWMLTTCVLFPFLLLRVH